ncbi:MAG TPA: PEGA domain-containing protein [Polyangiaceae bacterium]|nr:PEGA domain-containing protein [Polyangiaceae bacterium]
MIGRARLPLALAALLAAAPARAQPGPKASDAPRLVEAREHTKLAVALYQIGNRPAALVEFKRAYELVPNHRVLYNIARIDAELQDYAAAVRAYEQFLAEGGTQVPAGRRAEVEAELARLATRVATVTVSVNVDGANVLVDGTEAGRSPLAKPLLINAGPHTIVATKPPLRDTTRSIEAVGGDRLALSLELTPPPPPQPQPPPPRPAPPAAPPRSVPWVGVALAGTFAAGAVASGVLALDARRDFERELARTPWSADATDRARTRMHVFAIATDVSAVAAVAAAAITAYPLLFDKPAARQAAWGVRLGPGGVSLNVRF